MLKKIVLLSIVLLLVLVQFFPRRVFHRANPPVNPANSIEARAHALTPAVAGILQRACYDCHSHRTVWPWYSRVAPVGWLMSHDVRQGRREVNFSDWARYNPKRAAHKLQEICERVEEGEMPLWYYQPLHPASKLSAADKQAVCAWTRQESAALPTPAAK